MGNKKIVLILNTSQDYIKHTGEDEVKYRAQVNRLYEAITDTYIPLLNMFETLEHDEVPFKVGIVLTPVLCTLLDDPVIQGQYLEWLDKRIELGKIEIERVGNDENLLRNVQLCQSKLENARFSFTKYNQRITKKFHEYQKKGFIELIATCGTDIFLPHYRDMVEILNAQIETGLYAYRSCFGSIPEGFWLPELGYYSGVERTIRSYGMNYTVLDARSFLFSENEPKKGIFSPARFDNSLVCFSRDPKSDNEIFGEEGYSASPLYLDANRDVGYDLSQNDLRPYMEEGEARYALGYRYYCKQHDKIYDREEALKQVQKDAKDFLDKRNASLSRALIYLGEEETVSLVVTVNLNRLRRHWAEGIDFIEALLRGASKSEVEFALGKSLIENQYELQKIHPYYGSNSGVGYGEDLLSSKNNWMMRYVMKASERMVDLAERFPSDTGLKARLLNLGAKELLLAQSLGWAKMIHKNDFPEYAKNRFKQSITDFTAVFDALGSNTVSTEWLTKLEQAHQIFPWMNYRIFTKKC